MVSVTDLNEYFQKQGCLLYICQTMTILAVKLQKRTPIVKSLEGTIRRAQPSIKSPVSLVLWAEVMQAQLRAGFGFGFRLGGLRKGYMDTDHCEHEK